MAKVKEMARMMPMTLAKRQGAEDTRRAEPRHRARRKAGMGMAAGMGG